MTNDVKWYKTVMIWY